MTSYFKGLLLALAALVALPAQAALNVVACEPEWASLVKELGGVADAEMWEGFNMGCGYCAVVPQATVDAAAALLAAHHPGARRIGTVTDRAGVVELPALGLSLAR